MRIAVGKSEQNEVLELYLYRNEYQLATHDVLYSDGEQYKPLRLAFNALGKKLEAVKQVLMLGGGLASGARILARKGYFPSITLVEHDSVIMEWALATMPDTRKVKIKPACETAEQYIETHANEKYDMLVCDIFNGREVPDFVTTASFLQKCRKNINPGGYFILNYIVNDKEEWNKTTGILNGVFPGCNITTDGVNRIVIAKV